MQGFGKFTPPQRLNLACHSYQVSLDNADRAPQITLTVEIRPALSDGADSVSFAFGRSPIRITESHNVCSSCLENENRLGATIEQFNHSH